MKMLTTYPLFQYAYLVNGGYTEIHGDPPHILATFAGWERAHEPSRPGDNPIVAR
jgi:hypothetical protein